MKLPRLKYHNKKWAVNLPSIRAYTFDKEEIDLFIKNGKVPLDFDTNFLVLVMPIVNIVQLKVEN